MLASLLENVKTSPTPNNLVPLIGVCVDVSMRLKPENIRRIGLEYVHDAKVGPCLTLRSVD